MEDEQFNVSFTGPALYEVVVQGEIPESYLGRLGGMELHKTTITKIGVESVLKGKIADQAELSGILKSLYNLRLSIKNIALKEE